MKRCFEINLEWCCLHELQWFTNPKYSYSIWEKVWGRIVTPTLSIASHQARYRAMHKSPGAQRRSTSLPEWASLPARQRPNTAAPASDPPSNLRRSSHEVLGTSKSSLNLVYITVYIYIYICWFMLIMLIYVDYVDYVDLSWFMLILMRTRNWMFLRKLDLPRGAA